MADPQAVSPQWRFVPLAEFQKPAEPAAEAVRKSLRTLWRWLVESKQAPPESAAQDLETPGRELLDELVPPVCWRLAAEALCEQRPELRGASPFGRIVLLAGPHGCGEEMARLIAQRDQWEVLESPQPKEIVGGGKSLLSRVDWQSDQPLAIPRLEGFFLRQFDGMDAIRRLLDRLTESRRPCLLACQSWGWAFLTQSLRIDAALPGPLTLQGFDAANLGNWLRQAARGQVSELRFRQADNGREVLSAGEEPPPAEPADFLKQAASFSRGNLGVAVQVWRSSLRVDCERTPEPGAVECGRTVWVTPWSQLELPAPSSSLNPDGRFALQALLVHGRLTLEGLCHVLSLDPAQARLTLAGLRDRGLVESAEECWRVPALAYPAVRDFLQGEGFLVDAL